MTFAIEESVLSQIQLTESELKIEFSIFLYQGNRLTLSKASKLAGINRIEFQKQLASRKIPIHYDISDLEQDLKTIEKLERL